MMWIGDVSAAWNLWRVSRWAVLLLGAYGSMALRAQNVDIDSYIHQSWDKLQRSTTECQSLIDPKVRSIPVLYLPFGEPIPESIRALQAHCHVDVRMLPKVITHEGELQPEDVPTPGLLYLPHPYVVPGGRFNEMYGWDSYFILLGELAEGRTELARDSLIKPIFIGAADFIGQYFC